MCFQWPQDIPSSVGVGKQDGERLMVDFFGVGYLKATEEK